MDKHREQMKEKWVTSRKIDVNTGKETHTGIRRRHIPLLMVSSICY